MAIRPPLLRSANTLTVVADIHVCPEFEPVAMLLGCMGSLKNLLYTTRAPKVPP